MDIIETLACYFASVYAHLVTAIGCFSFYNSLSQHNIFYFIGGLILIFGGVLGIHLVWLHIKFYGDFS